MPVGVFFFFLHLCAERDDNQASWTRTAATVLLNIPLSLPQTCRFRYQMALKYMCLVFEGGKAGGRVTELQREPYRVAGWSPAQHRGSFLIICYQCYQVWLQGISLIREEKTQQAPALLSHQTL